jgi:hypothetical protein
MIRRSSLDAELHWAALTAVVALYWNHGIETFAVRMAPLVWSVFFLRIGPLYGRIRSAQGGPRSQPQFGFVLQFR